MTILAGVAQTTITPLVGVELAGYSFGPSVGVLDELEAQALYLDDGEEKLVIVAADTLTFGGEFVAALRRRVEETTGILASRVMLSATHTHSGPTTMPFRQWGAVDPAYIQKLEWDLAEVVARAVSTARPARLSAVTGEVETISENRRGAGGLDLQVRDTSVPLIRLDDERGRAICVLYTFGCHPVSLHSYRNLFSPDYPGYTRKVVRNVLGESVVVMFTLGPAGDINPRGYIPRTLTPEDSWRMGAILGCEVAKIALEAQTADRPVLIVRQENLKLPVVALPSAVELERMHEHFSREAEALRSKGGSWEEIARWEIQRDWAADALESLRQGDWSEQISCEVTAVRLGEAVLYFAPLELFTETGLAIKAASPAQVTLVCSNSNGALGYLPTLDAYASSDYTNPDGLAPKVYGVHAFSPEAEPLFRQQSNRLINEFFP